MTDQTKTPEKMPERIYVFNDPRSIGDLGFTRTDPTEDHDEYVRRDVAYPVTKEAAQQMFNWFSNVCYNADGSPEGEQMFEQILDLLEAASK